MARLSRLCSASRSLTPGRKRRPTRSDARSRNRDMPLELTQPWFLLGLFALPVVGWYFYRGLTDFSLWQRVVSFATRAVVVCLLVAALCGLTWLTPSKDLFVVFAVDDSLSVGDEAKPVIDKFLD